MEHCEILQKKKALLQDFLEFIREQENDLQKIPKGWNLQPVLPSHAPCKTDNWGPPETWARKGNKIHPQAFPNVRSFCILDIKENT